MIESRPQFDVLLSDIMMPGDMNGYDLARYVHEAKPELPVVFCTGYANELTKPHAMELAVHLLRKPFTASELTTALHRALDVRIP